MVKILGLTELRHNFLRRENMQPSAFGDFAARLLLWLFALWTLCSAARAGKPNVLFIAIDDLKPTLGCYDDAQAITPNIDRLAARGTVFTNAHCQWPVCGPSRASLMTSLRPEANGVLNLKTSMRAKDPNVLTLPQHFRNNGYATAGAGKIYDPRCVDDRKTADAPSWSIPFIIPKSPSKGDSDKRFADAPDVEDSQLIDGAIADDGLQLMRRLSQSDKPFFLAVGFKKPHLPFVAPKKYWDLYKRDQFKLATHAGGIVDASGYSIHDSAEFRGYGGVPESGEFSEDLQLEAIHGYYACTSYIDAQVGRLLDELKSSGLDKNTTIVLWGDHGFHLGDHGMWGKHSTLEQATRVPLLICPPTARISANATKKTASPVEFTDIFPTLCQMSGVNIPPQIAGRSLVPLMDGTKTRIRDGALTVFKSKGATGYSYRTQRYRYTEWVSNKFNKIAATELYDYEKDPLETKNVVEDPEYATVHARLAKQMRADGQGCEHLLKTAPNAVSMKMHNPPAKNLPTANAALQRLLEGNKRFIAGESIHPHENRRWRSKLEDGQHPFAVVLGCSDSRVPPELLFDQGFGDLFVIRVAGNVVDTDVKASVEYAVHHLDTQLIMVLGHTGCGAVGATVDHFANPTQQPKEVVALLKRIEPSLKTVAIESSRAERISTAVAINVQLAVQKLSSVPDLRECIDAGQVRIAGAVYDMHSGTVTIVHPSKKNDTDG